MSTDRVGTVLRRQPGNSWQVAVMREDGWFVVSPDSQWARQTVITSNDWEVVFRPPAPKHPVGTVMRRSGQLAHGKKSCYWEVATRAPEGWYVVSDKGPWGSLQVEQPPDDEDGTWEVLHGPVVDTRAS